MSIDYSKLVETQEQVVAKVQESLLNAASLTPEMLEATAKALEIHVDVLATLEASRRRS